MEGLTMELPAIRDWQTEIDDRTGSYTHKITLQNDAYLECVMPDGIELTIKINPLTGTSNLLFIKEKTKE